MKGAILDMFVREKTALIDQIMLANIRILAIKDIRALVKKDIVEIHISPIKYDMADGQEFSKLNIQGDRFIDKLIAGVTIKGNTKVKYCNLTLSVHDEETGNLCCFSVNDYIERIYEIQEYLFDEYGIEVDFCGATIKEIEINRTFRLEGRFMDYHRAIMVIMRNLPKELKSEMCYFSNEEKEIQFGSYYATSKKKRDSKRYTELKIYDKTKAVANKVFLTRSYMRVEISFISTQRIERAIGTKYFFNLTNELINQCYDKYMQRYMIRPYGKWKPKRDKYLLQIMKQERERDIRHWQINTLRLFMDKEINDKYSTLLDIEELFLLLEKLKLTPKRKYEVKRNFRKIAEEYSSVYCHGDDNKLDEIIEKVQRY